MNDYVIAGDTEQLEGCLIYVCGTLERAQEVLYRMLTNPCDNDKREMQRHHNIRIEEVLEKDCWWQRSCD